jgi:hypothetical protein
MKNMNDNNTSRLRRIAALALAAAAWVPINAMAQSAAPAETLLEAGRASPGLTLYRPGGHIAHILPVVARALARNVAADSGPLLYHSGGSVMTSATITPIFWTPPTLQTGAPASMSGDYKKVQQYLTFHYPEHGIDNNNTQYYEQIGATTTFIHNTGRYEGSYVDTSAYPASGCADTATPGNCLTDVQIQAEITNVITSKNLTNGLNRIFLLYTSSGEGSCFDASNGSCAYVQYCAYHSYYDLAGAPVIYANMPYGNTSVCQVFGVPSPNNDPPADTVATAASHEISEAITDPFLNAWFTSSGNEISDLCAYNYGANSWTSNLGIPANQFWSGTSYAYFELQQEFDNHVGSCVQIGP